MTLPIELETLLRRCSGFHPISAIFLMACAANFGVETLKNTSASVDLSLTIWLSIVGSVVSKLSSATIIEAALAPRAVLQALDVILAVVVVLIVRLPAHGPRKVLRIVPFGGAGGDEQLRHLLRVHVFVNRGIRRRAERIEDEQNLVAFHQLARLLDRLRRAVAIVIADEIDLAAVDAAGIV